MPTLTMAEILVVDDDQSMASAFERFLAHEGHACMVASNAEEALKLAGEADPDLVIMDIKMPGVDGLTALQQMRSRYPDLLIVMMTAFGTSQTSIDAIREGAFEYLTKPLDLDQLRVVIRQALAARESTRRAPDEGSAAPSAVRLVGEVPAMQDVYRMIGRLAVNDVPALVLGERGTGKELVVATIHANSSRREQPFATVDCLALSEDALEAELFAPRGGTLHLAFVHALSKTLQTKLIRVISDEHASTQRDRSAPRIIASTDEDLAKAVEAGSFSRQLYEALSVITLRLLPLRERAADIPLLVRYFIQRFNEQLNRTITGADEDVLRRFRDHTWPGNVGELQIAVKRACIVTRGPEITMDDVGDSLSEHPLHQREDVELDLDRTVRDALRSRLAEATGDAPSSVFHEIVTMVETALVKEALAITSGNQVKASEMLGVNRATLRKKANIEQS
jgi:DNA-binding NtrC family response regulator